MRAVSGVRRSGRLAWALLLVALVSMVGLALATQARGPVGAGRVDAGVALGGAPSDAIAPARAAGVQLAEPALERAFGDGASGAVLPAGLSRVELIERTGHRVAGVAAPSGALRGLAGMRGPPSVRGSSPLG